MGILGFNMYHLMVIFIKANHGFYSLDETLYSINFDSHTLNFKYTHPAFH